MRFHKEGHTIIFVSTLGVLVVSIMLFYLLHDWSWILIVPLCILLGLIVGFFRNPVREYNAQPEEIIAPVDGKVVIVKEVYEKEYLKKQCLQISIFMSPLNVHVLSLIHI